MKLKNLYIGYFNFNLSTYIERCYAYSERQAWVLFCRRLAKKHGLIYQDLMNYFNGEKDNYRIDLEVEFKEVED